MKKQICGLLAGAMLLCAVGTAGVIGDGAKHAAAPEAVAQESEALNALGGNCDISDEYISPLVTLRADPYLYKDKNTGKYYFTGSYPAYDRIELTCADSINGIAAAVPKEVWHMAEGSAHVWAPEIHYIQMEGMSEGKWVIYFAQSSNPRDIWDIKCYALICDGQDPMQDNWGDAIRIQPAPGDGFTNVYGMNLDMTVFETGGNYYAVWAQKPDASNLYIAKMKSLTELETAGVLLTTPEYAWESVNQFVNEGPGVFKRNGKIYLTFSASATDSHYCMGLMEIEEDEDPLDISKWKKYDHPVYESDPALLVYGPGHNNYVEGEHGELLCIMHFRDYRDIAGVNDSLYDYNRHAHLMKIKFAEDGTPLFHFDPEDIYNSQYTDHPYNT